MKAARCRRVGPGMAWNAMIALDYQQRSTKPMTAPPDVHGRQASARTAVTFANGDRDWLARGLLSTRMECSAN